MWRKFHNVVFLVLAMVGMPLWASVQRDGTMGEFKNDVDWAVDVLDVKKLKQSFLAAGGRNANIASLSYFELTAGVVKVLPLNIGLYLYDSEAIVATNKPAHRTNLNFSGAADENVTRTVSEQKWLADNSTRIFATAADISALGLPFSLFYRITYRGNNTTNATFAIDFANRNLGAISSSTVVETYATNDNQVLTRTKTTYGDGTLDSASLRNELTLATKFGDLVLLVPVTVDLSGTLRKAMYTQVVENPAGTATSRDTAEVVRDGKGIVISAYPRIAFPLVKGTDVEVALNIGYGLRNPKAVSYKRVQENIPANTVDTSEYKEELKNYLYLPTALQLVVKQSYKLGDAVSLKGRVRTTLNYTLTSLLNQTENSTETKVGGTVTASEKVVIRDTYTTNLLSVNLQMPLGVEYALQKWFVLRFGTRFDYTASWRWAQQLREKPSREVNGNPAPIGGTSNDPVNTFDSSYAFTTTSATAFALGFGWLATENFQMDFGYEFGGTGDIFCLSQWKIEAIYRF